MAVENPEATPAIRRPRARKYMFGARDCRMEEDRNRQKQRRILFLMPPFIRDSTVPKGPPKAYIETVRAQMGWGVEGKQ